MPSLLSLPSELLLDILALLAYTSTGSFHAFLTTCKAVHNIYNLNQAHLTKLLVYGHCGQQYPLAKLLWQFEYLRKTWKEQNNLAGEERGPREGLTESVRDMRQKEDRHRIQAIKEIFLPNLLTEGEQYQLKRPEEVQYAIEPYGPSLVSAWRDIYRMHSYVHDIITSIAKRAGKTITVKNEYAAYTWHLNQLLQRMQMSGIDDRYIGLDDYRGIWNKAMLDGARSLLYKACCQSFEYSTEAEEDLKGGGLNVISEAQNALHELKYERHWLRASFIYDISVGEEVDLAESVGGLDECLQLSIWEMARYFRTERLEDRIAYLKKVTGRDIGWQDSWSTWDGTE